MMTRSSILMEQEELRQSTNLHTHTSGFHYGINATEPNKNQMAFLEQQQRELRGDIHPPVL